MATQKIKFMDLAIGKVFTFELNKYTKTEEQRISCCTVINAARLDNPEQKIQVLPLIEVEVETTE
jgi:hypothetical protein